MFKKPANLGMLKVTKHTTQIDIFGGLGDSLDQMHSLYLLANSINWALFDDSFKEHYSQKMGVTRK